MDAPPRKKPLGIVLISGLLMMAALALLVRTILVHKGGFGGLSRLITVLVFATIGLGLWKLRNGFRIFLFFLIVASALGCLVDLPLYALRRHNNWLAFDLVVAILVAVGLLWYLQRPEVKRAFGGGSAWPTTVQMLVVTIFTTLLAFPFVWMAIASFKQNIDLYATENNPFLFNLPPTLDHLRFIFADNDFRLVLFTVEVVVSALFLWAVSKFGSRRWVLLILLLLGLTGNFFALRYEGYRPDVFTILHICIVVLLALYSWRLQATLRVLLLSALAIDLIISAVALFGYALNTRGFVRWLGNTTLVGIIVVAITLALALPAAYALARLTGRWGERLGIGIFLTYLVPPTLLFIPLARVVATLGLQDTIWSLVLVYPSVTVPFSVWLLMGFFKSIPRELEDAAMVDGLTRFGAFVKMVIPISLSGILTVVIFTFTLVTQEFVYALTFISPESQQMVGVGVPIVLVRGDVYYWGALMAACLIASLPIAFLYNLFLDRFIAGFTVGAVKG